ncbi:MFS transporter [uncultured Agrobacterium sp.]|uniref:MFS transporter n=1 Tax=uncultured Agrobacterium sp. TaxID=157277 RepID=UPI00258EF8F1|nr:MFS transporter [uncultured Agrobacterium sp.]
MQVVYNKYGNFNKKGTIVIGNPSTGTTQKQGLRRAFVASLTGTSLEWYDFAVYGVAAALVFGQLFFPGDDALTGTLKAFGTYAVGYISRPLGGIVFGRLGDVVGRKKVLIWTLLLIGVATFLIGLLPSYATAGHVGPAMLVLLRFAQGVGVGGEWGGAVLLTSEFSKPEERGFWASAAQVGPPLGTLLANGVLALIAAVLTNEQFMDWGWRLAFLLSAVLVAFGLWIRHHLEETPVFKMIEERGERPSAPVTDIFKTQMRPLIAAILSRVGPDVLYGMFAVFVLTYATTRLGMPRGQAITAVMIGSACQVFLIPFSGWLSDKLSRKIVYGIGAVGGGIWIFIFFNIMQGASFPVLIFGVTIGLLFHSLMYGPQAAFIAEQFHSRLRYTGSSLAYTFAGIIGGAVAPLIFTWLLSRDGSGMTIAYYIAGAAVVTLIGLVMGRTVVDDIDEAAIAKA